MYRFSPQQPHGQCVEVAKYPRQQTASGNKGKGKEKSKGHNGKDGTHDHDDSSVNDIALCADIKHAYERFKVGSLICQDLPPRTLTPKLQAHAWLLHAHLVQFRTTSS